MPASLWIPYARSEGGAASALTDLVGIKELVGATLLASVIVVFVDWRIGAVAWIGCLLSSFVVFAMAKSRIGGVTGDVLGAAVEVSETAALLAVVLTRPAAGL